jgi:hypothetical protein
MYISFIDPKYFKKSEKDDILILENNIWKYSSEYSYPMYYQDVAPYNKYKKYIYINIKYFYIEKYKNYLIIIVNDNKEVYIYDNNIIKKKNKNEWKNIDKKEITNTKWIYTSILRKINKEDILNVFNIKYDISKNTLLYSCHKKNNMYKWIDFFTFNKDDYLNDPFKIWYKKGDEMYRYVFKLTKDISVINLTCDILSNNKLSKTKSIDDLIDNNQINPSNIYNGNLNYIHYNSNKLKIWENNKGKRLFYEIIFKSSNFVMDIPYKKVLKKYNINDFIYSYGYYNKLDKYFNYEIYSNNHNNELEYVKLEKIILDNSY